MQKSITVRASGDIGPGGRGRVITEKQADGRHDAVYCAENGTVTPAGPAKHRTDIPLTDEGVRP